MYQFASCASFRSRGATPTAAVASASADSFRPFLRSLHQNTSIDSIRQPTTQPPTPPTHPLAQTGRRFMARVTITHEYILRLGRRLRFIYGFICGKHKGRQDDRTHTHMHTHARTLAHTGRHCKLSHM